MVTIGIRGETYIIMVLTEGRGVRQLELTAMEARHVLTYFQSLCIAPLPTDDEGNPIEPQGVPYEPWAGDEKK